MEEKNGEERERRTAVGLNVECKVFYRPGGPARSASENQSGKCEWSEIGRRANTGRCSFLDIDCFPLVPQTFASGAWSLLKFTGLLMYMPALPLTSRSLYVFTYYVSTCRKVTLTSRHRFTKSPLTSLFLQVLAYNFVFSCLYSFFARYFPLVPEFFSKVASSF